MKEAKYNERALRLFSGEGSGSVGVEKGTNSIREARRGTLDIIGASYAKLTCRCQNKTDECNI